VIPRVNLASLSRAALAGGLVCAALFGATRARAQGAPLGEPPAPPSASGAPAAPSTEEEEEQRRSRERLKRPIPNPEASIGLRKPSGADEEEQDPSKDPTPRGEPAGFPVVSGSSDIGVQFGVAGVYTRHGYHDSPHSWRLDGLLSLSVKPGRDRWEVVQQAHAMRFDVPHMAGGRLRIDPSIYFEKTINAGYFGVGNATKAILNADGSYGHKYQYIHVEARSRVNLRYQLRGPLDLGFGLQNRFVDPEVYADSKLEDDLLTRDARGEPLVRGIRPATLLIPQVGFIWDTRDNETVPTRGSYDAISIRGGFVYPASEEMTHGGVAAVVRRYVPLGPFVLAVRGFADLLFGKPPFYELSSGGPFVNVEMIGGPQAVRGIPNGRYQGLVRVIGNAELRLMHWKFKLFGNKYRLGNNVFADVGRVWTDYKFDKTRDGEFWNWHYGVGFGTYLLWGTSALFRVEVAYSPDAESANPGFPFGIYVAEGQMF
jgi:hypothetical protein